MLERKEVTFEIWRDALHPEDRERVVAALNEALEHHREFNVEYRVLREDGAVRWMADHGGAVYDESGRAVRMAGANLDITERKQAEAEHDKLLSRGRPAQGRVPGRALPRAARPAGPHPQQPVHAQPQRPRRARAPRRLGH